MITQKVLIECREVTFFISANIPVPKYRIGQLVMVNKHGSWLPVEEMGWFPARITGMMWEDLDAGKPKWEYQVKLFHLVGIDAFESFYDDEMCLLEDGLMLPSFVANKVSDQC